MPEFAKQPPSAIVYGGLTVVAARILGTSYTQEDTGTTYQVERCLVDANWGPATDLVYEFCRRSPHAAVLMPSHGKYIGASSNPMSTWQRKPGDRAGPGWRLYPGESGRGRHLVIDVNYWKTFAAERLRTPAGGAGAIFLFAPGAGRDHSLLADHFTAEYPIATSAKGRTVEEWKLLPGRDNDWFDCFVGCLAAASVQGVKWSAAVAAGGEPPPPRSKKPKRDLLAEFHAQAAKNGQPTWG
jgi:phage terminase large subunit GpA-like protein